MGVKVGIKCIKLVLEWVELGWGVSRILLYGST